MAKYRNNLPQMSDKLFMTDGGLETTLIFQDGFELPEFAAFDILKTNEGQKALDEYFRSYARLAQQYQVGFVLESPTWRASNDWGAKIGYFSEDIVAVNHKAVEQLVSIRNEYEDENSPIVISGCIGPRGDAYKPETMMTASEAEAYHRTQIQVFHGTDADMVSAITMTYTAEAIGITRAAQSMDMPVVISFTVETDGNLPSGESLQEAVETVDSATNNAPAYYMINCAHPTHFANKLDTDESWVKRLRGIHANASCMSHAELDESEELDEGNPIELGNQYQDLRKLLPNINVLGGCCGTDQRHIEEIIKQAVAEVKA